MRVLVIGSARLNSGASSTQGEVRDPALFEAAHELGQALTSHDHTILICSANRTTVDPYIFEGARSGKNKFLIEVHYSDGHPPPFEDIIKQQDQGSDVTRRIHLSQDTQVVHMEAMDEADALIIMGGSDRSVRTGVAAHMLGKTVVPVGAFGGAGKDIWAYASSRRSMFYKNGLTDAEIDKLAEPWRGKDSAEFVVGVVERVRKAAVKESISPYILSAIVIIMILSMVGWVGFITYGFRLADLGVQPIGMIFTSVCFAGLLGSSLKGLVDMRNGLPVTRNALKIDVALGLGAGFVSAMLYLVLQVAVTGKADSIQDKNDYVRVGLLVSLVAVFAAMYLDAAFANFDAVKGQVLSGEVGTRRQKKS